MTDRSSSGRNSGRRAKDFQRVYKACESCRKKKIRCVLDGSGNPPGPPCARCKREIRECVFSLERSTRRRDSTLKSGDGEAPGAGPVNDGQSTLPKKPFGNDNELNGTTEDGQNNMAWSEMSFRPNVSSNDNGERDQQLHHNTGLPDGSSNPSNISVPPGDNGLADTVMRTVVSSGNDALNLLFRAAEHQDAESPQYAASGSHTSQPAGEFATPVTMASNPNQVPPTSAEVLRVWDAFRFVKMGWFSSEEAVAYFDLFAKNLAPLSPLCQGIDLSHDNHFHIITQEPLLCCTILMISSRLWEHCQHLIMRIIFGQEKRSKAKTRTIGAIEALLLVVEWHPKAIHFPPAADGWDSDLLLSSNDRRDNPFCNRADITDDPGARWLGEVVAPARMSDRMSWMLLGCAQSLAHEMGICDLSNKSESTTPQRTSQTVRGIRITKLLFIFVEQLSSRLGCTSMVPGGMSRCLSEPSADASESAFLSGWIELTNLLRTITDVLFPSASGIRQLLLSCRYVNIIKHFQQQLVTWKDTHLKDSRLKPNSFQELTIEYHNLRIYMNSLGMQAVVDRILDEDSTAAERTKAIQLSLTATDYEFIQEVIDGSCQILRSVNKLAEAGSLRFCPVRIFLRTIAASIFLLKALSLGSHTSNLQASLAVLEQSVQALHASSFDDMHLASRYATLLDRHVARFRQSLVPSSVPKGIPPSLEWNSTWGNENGLNSQLGHTMPTDFSSAGDDWLSLPFDPSMAPFEFSGETFDMTDLDDRAWEFVWNLPVTS